MLSKCANPDCSAPFDYRQGRLFRVQTVRAGFKHLWLCELCAETHTVRQDSQVDDEVIVIKPRSRSIAQATHCVAKAS
jgi:hypothetical protein